MELDEAEAVVIARCLNYLAKHEREDVLGVLIKFGADKLWLTTGQLVDRFEAVLEQAGELEKYGDRY